MERHDWFWTNTFLRAAWLGFGISFPVFLLLATHICKFSIKDCLKSHTRQAAVFGGAALLLAGMLWTVAPARFHAMMKIENLMQTGTLAHRLKFYRASVHLFKQTPLFGYGLWSYRNLVYEAQAEINRFDPDYFKDHPDPKPRRVHSEYLEVLNDGGMVAAAALLVFFLTVARHGWRVVRSRAVLQTERILAATAFAALSAIMVTSIFFFSFRIISTLVMTVLMLAVMEAVYLRNEGLVAETRGRKWSFSIYLIPVLVLILFGVIWFRGYRPFRGEMAYFKYKNAVAQKDAALAETKILEAIAYDPDSTTYNLDAGFLYLEILRDYVKAGPFIEKAVIKFNGDFAKWAVYHARGEVKYRLGSLFEARDAYKSALYYYPEFLPSRTMLAKVEKVFQEEDTITLKLK